MTRAAAKLAAGDARAPLPNSPIAEVARLAAMFGEMRERLAARTSALEQAEAKFRGLLETAPDAIVTVDRDGRIVLVNTQTEKVFGHVRDELIGQPIELLLPERLREAHVRHRTAYFSAPHACPPDLALNVVGQRKDGNEFPAEVRLSPLETPKGPLATAVIRDVTDRKRMEMALRESEARFRRLAENAQDIIYRYELKPRRGYSRRSRTT